MNKNDIKNLKKLQRNSLTEHNKKMQDKLNSNFNDVKRSILINEFKKNKRIKALDWLLIFTWTLFIIGLVYLFSLLSSGEKGIENKKVAFLATIFFIVNILIIFVVNFIRNKKASNYFNDRRMRYQKTFSKAEALLIKIRNCLIISSFVILILTIIFYCL